MMSDRGLIELKLADGTSVFVESTGDRAAGSGPQRVSRGPSGAEEAETRFEEAVARIRPAAQALLDSLRGLNTPEQIDLEFGIKFNAKAGVIFASVDSEAVFKVAIRWKNAGGAGAEVPAAEGS
ncbi:CU044_2847 family protein [uncultured Lamprocystis sp.]|jgi:hypothetical protein|uniref:CU044_2847 family protein n=2 Tax=uncultured Lamprocystis sp. TaxID=543132 RepID=UPI0025E12AF9|nr:CU044_2847 family protein [uncultured Lamprocystis sp.]